MGRLTLKPHITARNMAIAAKVLLFIGILHNPFCTDQTRNDWLVICCNPYP